MPLGERGISVGGDATGIFVTGNENNLTLYLNGCSAFGSESNGSYSARLSKISWARSLERLRSAGLDQSLALDLLGRLPESLPRALEEKSDQRVVVLVGELGLGKSEIGELWHRKSLDLYSRNEAEPLPFWVRADDFPETAFVKLLEWHSEGRKAVDLVVDGLDELPGERAASYIRRARDLVSSNPRSRVTLTARPGSILVRDEELVHIKPLEESRAMSLIRDVARTTFLPGHGWSESIRDAIRRPLFALVAGVVLGKGGEVSSPAQLMNSLVTGALTWRGSDGYDDDEFRLLKRAAIKTSFAPGPVSAREIATLRELDKMRGTSLVVIEHGKLLFPLPVVQQWLAAQALLDGDVATVDVVSSVSLFARWRFALSMACEAGSASFVDESLAAVVRLNPGAGSWLMRETVRGWFQMPVGSATSAFATRLRASFEAIFDALGPIRSALYPTDDMGSLAPLAVRWSADSVSYAWKRHAAPQDARIYAVANGESLAPREWAEGGSTRLGDTPLAPWKLAYDDLAHRMQSVVGRASPFLLRSASEAYREWLWALASHISGTLSSLRRPDIQMDDLVPRMEKMIRRYDRDSLSYSVGRGRLNFDPSGLSNLLSEFKRSAVAGTLRYPWTRPDLLSDIGDRSAPWVWKLYTDDALLSLTKEIYTAASSIYNEIVDAWFSSFAPMMGCAITRPAQFKGFLIRPLGDSRGDCPSVILSRVPRPEASETMSISLTNDKRTWRPAEIEEFRVELERLIEKWTVQAEPGTVDFATFTTTESILEAFNAMPATRLALGWIYDDLRRLGIEVKPDSDSLLL